MCSWQVAKAPDGNGGLYAALEDSGTLADMAGRGVEALDVLCVDNILARVGDPVFVGACYARGSELGARMLAKAYPEEKVGVFAQDERGRMQVGAGTRHGRVRVGERVWAGGWVGEV